MGAIVASAFSELRAQGVGLFDALEQLQPTIQALREQLKETGFAGGAAFNQIAKLARIASDEVTGPTLQAIDGLNQAMLSMQNIGLLDQKMFTGLAKEATAAFQQLLDQGVKGNDALRLMQPTLQTLWELQQQFGYGVDAATQKLIDQAVEAGLVGEKHMSVNERIAQSMEKVVEQLEILVGIFTDDLPGAVGTSTSAIENFTQRLKEIPNEVSVVIKESIEQSGAGIAAINANKGFSSGVLTKPTFFPIMAHPPEIVQVGTPAQLAGSEGKVVNYVTIAPQIILDSINDADEIKRRVVPPMIDAIREDYESFVGEITRKQQKA